LAAYASAVPAGRQVPSYTKLLGTVPTSTLSRRCLARPGVYGSRGPARSRAGRGRRSVCALAMGACSAVPPGPRGRKRFVAASSVPSSAAFHNGLAIAARELCPCCPNRCPPRLRSVRDFCLLAGEQFPLASMPVRGSVRTVKLQCA